MKLEIFITEITYTFESVGFFDSEDPERTECTEAHVGYQIIKPKNIIHGTLDIPFPEYERLYHGELLQRVFRAVQDSVKQ